MITSTANERVKEIRKLRERKYRSETGFFLAEGTKIVLDAINSGVVVQQLVIAPELIHTKGGRKALELAAHKNMEVLEVSTSVFNSISEKDNPQGIAGVFVQTWTDSLSIDTSNLGLWLGLFEVADPGNLGTIMRTMDAVGGKGLFLIDNCTDPYDPSAIRASMGAVFSQKLCKMSKLDFVDKIKSNSLYAIGTSDAAIKDFHDQRYQKEMILCMGSERQGIPSDIKEVCAATVSIPMLGTGDSLNLAVATGIVLYEILHQTMKNNNQREK